MPTLTFGGLLSTPSTTPPPPSSMNTPSITEESNSPAHSMTMSGSTDRTLRGEDYDQTYYQSYHNAPPTVVYNMTAPHSSPHHSIKTDMSSPMQHMPGRPPLSGMPPLAASHHHSNHPSSYAYSNHPPAKRPRTEEPPPMRQPEQHHADLEALRNQVMINATYAYGHLHPSSCSRWDIVTSSRTQPHVHPVLTTYKAILVLFDCRTGEARTKMTGNGESRVHAMEMLLKIVEGLVEKNFVGGGDPRDCVRVPDVWA